MNLKDSDFIRGDVPMTKFAIRSLIMAYMDIKENDRFLDIERELVQYLLKLHQEGP